MTTPEADDVEDVEEPVDEQADNARLGVPQGGLFSYTLLTATDRHALRIERAHDLEADLYRLELRFAEAADHAEQEALGNRADELLRRLRVHLSALSTVLPDPPPT